MKLKSFKKKGATGDALSDTALMRTPLDHYNYPIEQIKFDSKQQHFDIMWKNENDDRFLDTGDILAVTIDDGQDILTARVAKVSMVGDRLVARIAEHQKALLMSSKPSSRWTRFLTELKKKCDSGHHNKKRKTLLHVIKMAQGREANPESIQLWLSERVAKADEPEIMINEAGLGAALGKIQRAIGEGDSLDLDELADLIVDDDVFIADANHTPERAQLGAITIVANRVSVTALGTALGNKQSIAISEKDLEKAALYNTQQNGPANLGEYILENLLDTTKRRLMVYVYSHDHGLTVHSNKYVKKITKSSNGEFEFELEPDLAAGSRIMNLESALIAITSSKLEDGGAVDGSAIADGPFDGYDQILELPGDNYELISLPDSNIRRVQLLIPDASEWVISQLIEGDPYFVSVGDAIAVFTVDRLVDDMIAEPVKQILVELSYMGGADFALLEAALSGKQEKFIMKRLQEASQQRVEAIQLILEKRHLADSPYTNLPEIADGIDGLIGEDLDQDGISVAELAAWVDENPNLTPDLVVTGVKYKPKRLAYNTKSSVTSGLKIDVWMSARGEYSLFDLKTKDLSSNWQSVVHSSTIVDELPEPESEVKIERFAQLVDEVRQAALDEVKREKLDEVDLDPSKQQELYDGVFLSIYSEELYNGEEGYTVCNNEEIHKILRKKKDGKCIYRIVVKNGAMANRIYHGKHGKCIMYIDRQKSLS